MLNILLPTTFPMLILADFFIAAITDVISSGSDEPTATTVSPIILSLIPMIFANPIPPFTKILAPVTKTIIPAIINMALTIRVVFPRTIFFIFLLATSS